MMLLSGNTYTFFATLARYRGLESIIGQGDRRLPVRLGAEVRGWG
jgi:hypothetical protein